MHERRNIEGEQEKERNGGTLCSPATGSWPNGLGKGGEGKTKGLKRGPGNRKEGGRPGKNLFKSSLFDMRLGEEGEGGSGQREKD